MSNEHSGWKIQGLHETEKAGECALVCEDLTDANLVFFKIINLKEGEEDFQALDSRQMIHRSDKLNLIDDEVVAYRSVIAY